MSVIKLEDWSIRFSGYFALEKISLEIPEGSFTAVMGPNGSGKSTLMKSIVGLIAPSTGSIRIFDKPPGMIPFDNIGYVPQVKGLDRSFPALAGELVVSGLTGQWPFFFTRTLRRKSMEALERVGAEHLIDRPMHRLSGGELQRVYLARSMMRNPSLLLLDEPAAGVDQAGEEDMYRLLEEYQERTGASILIVTHDLEVARYHSSHVLLLNCRKVSFGPPENAMTDDCMRRAFGHVGHDHRMHGGKDA